MNKLSFQGAHIVFATKHKKSLAAKAPFARLLNATVDELPIESDTLGTFSGEVPRPGSMLDALRGKVALARSLTRERFVLASEGSFGSAGGLGLLAQGVEMLLLHDAQTGTEIIEQHISLTTNYAYRELQHREELAAFLRCIRFGSHGLLLYPKGLLVAQAVHKGITKEESAHEWFSTCLKASPQGAVVAMSDMRAHINPTRMGEIGACCELLAQRLATRCARCESGGFGLTASVPGLPCSGCGAPTQRARAEKHSCAVCGSTLEFPRADGRRHADPAECEWCNP